MRNEGQTLMEGTPLDEKARRMLSALEALGPGWHSRAELAAHLGKTKLNPVDIIALDTLAALGRIDRRMQPMPGRPQVNQTEYRIEE
jgi:hypothetical protein